MTHVGAYTIKGFSAPLIMRTSGLGVESGTGMEVASAEARGVAWTSLCRNRLATEAPVATVEAAAEGKKSELILSFPRTRSRLARSNNFVYSGVNGSGFCGGRCHGNRFHVTSGDTLLGGGDDRGQVRGGC